MFDFFPIVICECKKYFLFFNESINENTLSEGDDKCKLPREDCAIQFA